MLRRLAHVAVDIAGGDIDKNETDQFAVLAANRGRAGFVMDVGQHRNRHLRASRRRHQHALKRVEVLAKIARVPRVDWIALAAFHGGGDVLATDR